MPSICRLFAEALRQNYHDGDAVLGAAGSSRDERPSSGSDSMPSASSVATATVWQTRTRAPSRGGQSRVRGPQHALRQETAPLRNWMFCEFELCRPTAIASVHVAVRIALISK